MRIFVVLCFVAAATLLGADRWKAIVTPGVNVYLSFGKSAIGEAAEPDKADESGLEKLQSFVSADRQAELRDLVKVGQALEAVPGFRTGLKNVRLCDSFTGKTATAVAYEFAESFGPDKIEEGIKGKLKVSRGKAAELDMLAVELENPLALVFAGDGKYIFLVFKKEANAIAARITESKYCAFTAEMKHLMQFIGSYAGGCLEITGDMRRKINEKASNAMAEKPMEAMMLMKFAEMKGLVVDAVKKDDAYTLIFGFSNVSPLVAAGVKEQLFDGMAIPMFQAMAQGAAPGNTQVENMFSSYVKGRTAFMKVQMKTAEIKAIRQAM